MTRIKVYEYPADDYAADDTFARDLAPRYVGHFELESARHWQEARDGDAGDISRNTGSTSEHQALYRTAGGRWVLNSWSRWVNTVERYEFISDETARDWLIKNDEDKAAAEFFDVPDEAGPVFGRREIGPKVEARIPEDARARLDELAAAEGVKRADYLRRLILNHIQAQHS